MNRPEQISERLANIRQIKDIVGTFQALASAHQVEARKHLGAIRAHERQVAGALSIALAALMEEPNSQVRSGQGLAIMVGVTQGFCGAYAERFVDAGRTALELGTRLMVVGARTSAALSSSGNVIWTGDMAAHAREVPALASRLADALFGELVRTPGLDVKIVFADPADPQLALETRLLLPFDFSRFPPSPTESPMMTLGPGPLVAALVEEYIFTELCEALVLGFASENVARASAMARAKSNVERKAEALEGEFRRARQEQMTTEIIERSTGASTSVPA